MDDNLNPYSPESSAEPPPRIGRRLPRAALTGGLAVGLALGGAGLAYAATSSSSSTTPAASKSSPSTTAPGSPKGPRGPMRAGRMGLGAMGLGAPGLGKVVHGTFTVRTGSGFKTVEVQIGQVVGVGKSSITIKSPDGFQQTYSVLSTTIVDSQAGGISSVANGDQVDIMATSSSGRDTATNIVDATKMKASRQGFGFGPPAGKPAGAGATGFGGFDGGGPGGGAPPTEAQ